MRNKTPQNAPCRIWAMKYYNIPIFVPHLGCPFDCVFCNQRRITGADGDINAESVKNTVEEHLRLLPKQNAKIEIAFFGGSFTGISAALQEELLSAAVGYVGKNGIEGIRVSTRPDYINDEVIARLLRYKVTTVELGVQSMNEEVLKASGRGHSPEDVESAVKLLKQTPLKLGLQMMTGLPKDTPERSLETADKIIELGADIVRIYPTLVIKGTKLEKMYKSGGYRPQSVDEAVHLCARLLKKFDGAGVEVIRCGLQNTDEISPGGAVIAGPFHSAFGELAENEYFFGKIEEIVSEAEEDEIKIAVNPYEISKVIGQKRRNILKIHEKFGKRIKIVPDKTMKKGEIKGIVQI